MPVADTRSTFSFFREVRTCFCDSLIRCTAYTGVLGGDQSAAAPREPEREPARTGPVGSKTTAPSARVVADGSRGSSNGRKGVLVDGQRRLLRLAPHAGHSGDEHRLLCGFFFVPPAGGGAAAATAEAAKGPRLRR